MSLAYRVFLIHPDATIYRVPHPLLNQLCAWNPPLRLPEFASQRIRFVHLYVDVVNRLPVKVRSIEGQYVRFDEHGEIDTSSLIEAEVATMRQQMARTQTIFGDNVIDARGRFARVRCLWAPDAHLTEQLTDIALLRCHAPLFRLVPQARRA
jgi:hypothetical protein